MTLISCKHSHRLKWWIGQLAGRQESLELEDDDSTSWQSVDFLSFFKFNHRRVNY